MFASKEGAGKAVRELVEAMVPGTWQSLAGSLQLEFTERFFEYGVVLLRISLIIVGLVLVGKVGARLIDALLRPEKLPGKFTERRVNTLRGLARSFLRYTLYFVGIVMVLGELGVNTSSILAGAGIAGLALGFGAQNLVRDVISGFFILFEDQYAVGDYITVAGVSGTVEEIGLRVTKIREWTGQLHIIPNGEIKQVTNFARGGIGVLVEVEIAYEENLDRAIEVINNACRRVAEEHSDVVLEEPRVLGVERLDGSGSTLQVFGKVKPMQQWTFARELRLRIKEELDEAGITIASPRRVILHRGEVRDDASHAV